MRSAHSTLRAANRIFAASAVVTVIGMFAYLGTAYATSIRLAAIQGYSPLMTSIGFVCLNVMGVVLFPVSSRMIERHNPGWVLAASMACIGAGDLTLAAIPATNLSIAAVAVPLLLAGSASSSRSPRSPWSPSSACPRPRPAWPAVPPACSATSA